MKVEQVTTEIEITEITLLSIEEYKVAKKYIPFVNNRWWLRSPGWNYCAMCVNPNGSVDLDGANIDNIWVGVRPALRFNPASLNLQIGEKTQYDGRMFTRIAEDMLISDEIITWMAFREDWKGKDTNKYEISDIRKYLNKWLEKAQQITDWIPISEGLPKKNCETWVTIKNGDTRYVTAARFWASERSWDIPGHNNITAWMPKPAPYHE